MFLYPVRWKPAGRDSLNVLLAISTISLWGRSDCWECCNLANLVILSLVSVVLRSRKSPLKGHEIREAFCQCSDDSVCLHSDVASTVPRNVLIIVLISAAQAARTSSSLN